MKRCGRCGLDKLEDEFAKGSHQKCGLRNSCKECDSLRSKKFRKKNLKKHNEHRRELRNKNKESYNNTRKEWRKNNSDKDKLQYKKDSIKRMYGITLDQYNEMIKSQINKCPICLKDFDNKDHKPHIDHDHATEKVRSILCVQCNLGLGRFFDNTDKLKKAIVYLKKHPREHHEKLS